MALYAAQLLLQNPQCLGLESRSSGYPGCNTPAQQYIRVFHEQISSSPPTVYPFFSMDTILKQKPIGLNHGLNDEEAEPHSHKGFAPHG